MVLDKMVGRILSGIIKKFAYWSKSVNNAWEHKELIKNRGLSVSRSKNAALIYM